MGLVVSPENMPMLTGKHMHTICLCVNFFCHLFTSPCGKSLPLCLCFPTVSLALFSTILSGHSTSLHCFLHPKPGPSKCLCHVWLVNLEHSSILSKEDYTCDGREGINLVTLAEWRGDRDSVLCCFQTTCPPVC